MTTTPREEWAEALQALLGEACHGLNNVLASILMSADLLGRSSENGATAELAEGIRAAAQQGCDLIGATTGLLHGELDEPTLFQVPTFVRACEKAMRDSVPPGVIVVSDYPADYQRRARGAPVLLFGALLALASAPELELDAGSEIRLAAADAPGPAAAVRLTLEIPCGQSRPELGGELSERIKDAVERGGGELVQEPGDSPPTQHFHVVLPAA